MAMMAVSMWLMPGALFGMCCPCLWFYGWCVYSGRSARFVVCSDYRVEFIATVAMLAQLV